MFQLIAHRGASSDAPENTLIAFDFALECNVLHLETDAQLTQDGVVVLFHDDTLKRTTRGCVVVEVDQSWCFSDA